MIVEAHEVGGWSIGRSGAGQAAWLGLLVRLPMREGVANMARDSMQVVDDDPDSRPEAPAIPRENGASITEGVPRGALPHWIYSQIRHDIITGVYPASMRLNEQRLADALQVSRVPLRESFRLLERDGFIKQQPRRSAVVTGWDAQRVHNLFDTRLGIEVEATQAATERISRGGSARELQLMIDHSQAALRRGDSLGVAESNAEFHQLIVAATGNDLMISFMDQLAQRMIWLFYLTPTQNSEHESTEHRELIDAMVAGNVGLARSIAHAHIEKSRLPTLAALDLPRREAEPHSARKEASESPRV